MKCVTTYRFDPQRLQLLRDSLLKLLPDLPLDVRVGFQSADVRPRLLLGHGLRLLLHRPPLRDAARVCEEKISLSLVSGIRLQMQFI